MTRRGSWTGDRIVRHDQLRDVYMKQQLVRRLPQLETSATFCQALMRGNAALIVGRKPEDDFVGAEIDGVL